VAVLLRDTPANRVCEPEAKKALCTCLSVLSDFAPVRRKCNQGAFDEAVHLAISRYQSCCSHKCCVSLADASKHFLSCFAKSATSLP
jgi:hypothetical protein